MRSKLISAASLVAVLVCHVGQAEVVVRSRRDRALPTVIQSSPLPYAVGRPAKPTYGPDYGYGWVGGGAPSWRGEPRRTNEGVWGRDYQGVVYLRRVWPNWWHGQRKQGGAGAYRTDGPKLLGHR